MTLEDFLDQTSKGYGECFDATEALCKEDPTLTQVRGCYDCPIWGMRQHWWCKDQDGTIIDPTKNQFPSKGIGQYVEFAGTAPCEYCGEETKEEEAYMVDQHFYCSYNCYGRDIGL